MFLSFGYIVLLLVMPVCSLIVEGQVKTEKDWLFLTRYCYQTDNGKVQFHFVYPSKLCCQDVVLYYDGQWPDVYPQESMSCVKKIDVTNPEHHQVLTLRSPNAVYGSGCKTVNDDIVCEGSRDFRSVRARWWYLVISHCGSTQGLEMTYRLILTNGDGFWDKHFSADEKYVLQTDIFILIMFILILLFSLYVASILISRQLFHTTYKMYLWVVLFEVLSISVNMAYYVDYGETGYPKESLKNIARGCHCISDTIFVVLLILLGKGWTVTRGKISSSGQVKLTLFCTFYAIAYITLFIYEAMAFDPGEVLYIYESPAGVGICVLRVIGWLWFCYCIFFTLKNYADKRHFYYPFWMFYTLWFLSGPIIVMVATYMLDAYVRAQIVNGVERSVATISCLFFLILTRPSAANKNFPYHVRTSQIGIISRADSDQNFEHNAYVPNEEVEHRNNIAAMFSAHNINDYGMTPVSRKHYESNENVNRGDFTNLNTMSFQNISNVPSRNLVTLNGDLFNTTSRSHESQSKDTFQAKPDVRRTSVISRPSSVLYRSSESLTAMFRSPSVMSSKEIQDNNRRYLSINNVNSTIDTNNSNNNNNNNNLNDSNINNNNITNISDLTSEQLTMRQVTSDAENNALSHPPSPPIDNQFKNGRLPPLPQPVAALPPLRRNKPKKRESAA